MKVVCAFSSDSRSLYKADIYRVLSLPKGGIVHFRYKAKYVADELLKPSASLVNKKVAIFFTRTEKNGLAADVCENISVRWAAISAVERSKETDVFHVYMRLEEFCNLSIVDTAPSNQPPGKFLSYLECKELQGGSRWEERVNALKDYFPKVMYFHVKSIKGHWGGSVGLTRAGDSRGCYYNLEHGGKYTLQLALANPDGGDAKLEFSDGTGEVMINCVTPLESSAQFDDVDIPLFVKSLQVSRQASFLEIKPVKDGEELGEYATSIELELELGLWKSVLFGFCSVLAVGAVLFSNPVPSTASVPAWWQYCIAGGVLWLASGTMFHWFNKK